MKKTILSIAILATLVLTSCGFRVVPNKGLGPIVTKNADVKPFSKIALTGIGDVYFTPADTYEVKIVGPEKAKAKVYTKDSTLYVEDANKLGDGTLIINSDDNYNIKIYVKAPALSKISIAGASDFSCEKMLTAKDFKISIAGSGDVYIAKVKANSVKAKIAGSGDIDMGIIGAENVRSAIAGSGDIDLNLMHCNNVDVEVSGSGDISLSGDVKNLSKEIEGSGEIDTKDLFVNGTRATRNEESDE